MNWPSHFGLKGEGYGHSRVSPRKLVLRLDRDWFSDILCGTLKVCAEWKRGEETLLCAPISKKTSFQVGPSLYLATMTTTMTAGNVTRRQPAESVLAER